MHLLGRRWIDERAQGRSPWWCVCVVLALLPHGTGRVGCADLASILDRASTVEITGSKAAWQVRYLDARGRALSGQIRVTDTIRVPLQRNVRLELHSRDYIYTLAIPAFGLKEVAVPELAFDMVLQPARPGRLELVGEELCGDPHAESPRFLVVEPRERFARWLSGRL